MKSTYVRIRIVIVVAILLSLSSSGNNIITNANAELFTSDIRVDDTGTNISTQYCTSITVDNQGTIHVVWTDWRNDADSEFILGGGIDGVNNADIYYSKSIDGGRTFESSVKVNSGDGNSWQWTPDIAVDDNGIIHVVWEDWRDDADGEYIPVTGGIDGVNDSSIYYSHSVDGGQIFSPPIRADDDNNRTVQGGPSIALDSSQKIHIIWIDVRETVGGDIYYANSTDGGLTFNNHNKVNDVSKGSADPIFAVDANNVIYVVWVDNRNDTTKPDIYFSKSTDGGISFGANKKLNDDGLPLTHQGNPAIAVGGGLIGVVWDDHRTPSGLYFANSTDEGNNFSVNKRIDDDLATSPKSRPYIAMNKDRYISVAWMDKRAGDYDIYFANSSDGGVTFSPNQKVNDDIGSINQLPSLALRNRTVYIAWNDERNGNPDIFLARSNFPPSMAIPISPLDDSILTNDTPILMVTPIVDLDNDMVYYNFTISDQPDAESGMSFSSGWIDTTSWTTPILTDGKWYWHTYTSDMWNTTTPNWVWNFTIDATPPVIYNLKPPDASRTNEKKPIVEANYSDPSGINVSSILFEIDGSDLTSSATKTPSGIAYTPQSELSNGLHTILLEVEDTPGNLASISWSFIIDDKPIVEVWEPGGAQNQAYVQGDTVMVTWIVTDDNPLPANPINITYGNSTGGWLTISLNEANNGMYAWDTSTVLCPGMYWLNLSVYDSFGQTVFDESNYSFNITCPDTTPPVIDNIQPIDGSSTTDKFPVIGANFSDTSGINVSSVVLRVDGEDVTSSALVSANGIEYMPTSALSDGTHSIYLEVKDVYGNKANVTWTFDVDTQPIEPPDDFLADNWWILLILAVVIIVLIIILFFFWRRKRKSEDEVDSEP
jgi:hypothetical protein